MKPLTNLRVLAAKSERYPGNKICSQPECAEPVADFHHCFPRSQIAGDSWFVIISNEETGAYDSPPVPHVTGLCRAHHEAVERHDAWIRLEEGEWRWYDRPVTSKWVLAEEVGPEHWVLVAALNPQPGSVEGKPKRKKREKQPARKKAVYSTRIPKDEAENGYEVLDSLIDANRERLGEDMGWSANVPDYYVLCAVLAEGLQG